MPDYSKGKIYKIVDNTNGNVYIGSTCKKNLSERLSKHVSDYKRWLNGKTNFVTSFKILENGNYDIVLLELFPCTSKVELFKRERFWTNQFDCVNALKKQGVYAELGENEYYKQHGKQYYLENKEYIKARVNQYRLNNLDAIKQRKKIYRQKNAEKIRQHCGQVVSCDCGACHTLQHKARHLRSQTHQYYEQNKLYFIIKKGLDLIKAIDIKLNI